MRDDYTLVFEDDLPPVKPEVREFSAMKNYLKDPESSCLRRDVYHIYRDIALPLHQEAIERANLEYDITVIPPGKMGDELVKTIGHYHSCKPGTGVRYPEVYEVILGKLFLLLQSASSDLERLENVYLASAKRGEKVIVPPGFGHVSINSGDDVLVLSNWQSRRNKGIYEPFEAHNGAAYYVIQSERLSSKGTTTFELEFVPNLTYKSVPKLRPGRPRELPKYNLLAALPMYFTGTKNLDTLDFLVRPENYLDELAPEKLFNEKP